MTEVNSKQQRSHFFLCILLFPTYEEKQQHSVNDHTMVLYGTVPYHTPEKYVRMHRVFMWEQGEHLLHTKYYIENDLKLNNSDE
jgi:hypothetical protein